MSPIIQNEILKDMTLTILCDIVNSIKDSVIIVSWQMSHQISLMYTSL